MIYKIRQRIEAVRAGKTDTLNLAHFDLTELPDEVYDLTRLRVLVVANLLYRSNQGSLKLFRNLPNADPEFLAMMEEEERDLRNDLMLPRQLQRLDARIGRLTALEILDLRCNLLTELPETIGKLRRLRLLKLKDNRLTHLPASLAKLPNLHGLDVRENPLRSLPDLPQLERYRGYADHFRQQKKEACRERDFDLAAWFRWKECEFGFVKQDFV